jgi:hypothetical protein
MRAKYWPHARRGAASLELDCAIDTIRIGASQCPKPMQGRRVGEDLGAGDTNTKGEVRVDVEVDHSA